MRGKLRQVPHRSGAFQRPLQRWGDIITCDHMVQGDADWAVGCTGDRHVLIVKDLFTKWVWAYPMRNKSADCTFAALNDFVGGTSCALDLQRQQP